MAAWEVGLRSLCALLLIVSGADLSRRLALHLLGPRWRRALPLRWSSIGACGMWLAAVLFQLLYPLGGFRLAPALVICVAGAWGARLVERAAVRSLRVDPLPKWKTDWRALRLVLGRLRRAPHFAWVAPLLPAAVFVVVRSLLVLPSGWDTMTYHGVRAARWVQNAGFTYEEAPGLWTFVRLFFGGAEVLFAWAALPMHSDLFIGLSTVAQWILLGLAIWACCRALEVREPHGGLLALAWLFVPTVFVEVGSGYVEIALAAGVFTGMAALLHFVHAPHLGLGCLASIAFGVGAGTKIPGVLPAAVCGVALTIAALWPAQPLSRSFRIARDAALLAPWRSVAGWALLLLLPVAPWLLFNVYETGYPLSPIPVEIAGITLGVPDPTMQWLQERGLGTIRKSFVDELPYLLKTIGDFSIRSFTPGPLVGGWLLLLPVCLPIALVRRPAQALLLAAVLAVTVAFYMMPGMSAARIFWPYSGARYLLPALVCATLLNVVAMQGRPRWLRLYSYFVVATAIFCAFRLFGYGVWDGEYVLLVTTVACLLLVGVLLRRLSESYSPRVVAGVGVVAFVLLSVGLDAARVRYRPEMVENSFHVWPSPRYYADAVKYFDDGRAHYVAATSGVWPHFDNWPTFTLHGAYFQNRFGYVPISRDGEVVHFDDRVRPEQHGDRAAWITRLRERGITEVVSFRPRSLELEWMLKSPRNFEKVAGGRDWAVFRVRELGGEGR